LFLEPYVTVLFLTISNAVDLLDLVETEMDEEPVKKYGMVYGWMDTFEFDTPAN
jgi:hypothetical protein